MPSFSCPRGGGEEFGKGWLWGQTAGNEDESVFRSLAGWLVGHLGAKGQPGPR